MSNPLVKAGQALARVIGHTPNCKVTQSMVKCDCGAGAEQAIALDNWIRAVKEFNICQEKP